VNQLMGPANELEVVPLHEFACHLGAEEPTGSTRTDCPSVNVFRIGPNKVTKCS